MMRLLARTTSLILHAALPILLLPAAGAAQDEVAMASRRPRFLVPAVVRGAAPVEVDASRVPLLRRKVSLDFEKVRLEAALDAVASQSGTRLVYVRSLLPLDSLVRFRSDSITVAAALTELLLDLQVDVLVSDTRQIVLVPSAHRRAKPGSLVGRVTDAATGQGLEGTDVFVEGTRSRALTDTTGWYRLTAIDSGTYTLTARRVGYAKQSRRVTVRSEREDTVNFVLATVAVALNELVSTATGPQRRRDLGNAITTIRGDSVLRNAPIRSVTDLLENRVPGLTAQRTSGAPGDPSRIRLRGIGSALRSNDPVVIVDGIRIYASQAELRSGNLANNNVPAPSPLDQIDPNIIDKVEVFKGPSAATLYGADAANGVIVITTKKGRPGPTRWSASATSGRTHQPGRYPEGYYRFGHSEVDNTSQLCLRASSQLPGGAVPLNYENCVQDSLVRFQALNEPDLTPLGRGHSTTLSLTASGGGQTLTYSVTGSYRDDGGLLKLPDLELERFRLRLNREAPDWMQHPHRYQTWSVQSTLRAQLGGTADVALTTALMKSNQQRTDLESQVTALAGSYYDRVNDLAIFPTPGVVATGTLLSGYYTKTTASAITLSTGLTANWTPRSWFMATANAGINLVPRNDERLLPTGLVSLNDSGSVTRGSGNSLVSTVNVQGTFRKPLPASFRFETSIGANLTTANTNDLVARGIALVPGQSTIGGAREVTVSDNQANTSVYGWYIEPRLMGERLAISTGIRLDGGSAYGARVSSSGSLGNLLSLPKLSGSWVISEEPFFPFKGLFSSLRLRAAYGQAQAQPGPADRLRLYRYATSGGAGVELATIGNTQLRPERSSEIEGGFDADMLGSRIKIELSLYRKTKIDALMSTALPTSVGGGSVIQNIGNIRNEGIELVLGLTPIMASGVTWSPEVNFSSNSNKLVKIGRGVLPNKLLGIVEGYPMASRWERPILGYSDANGNGLIENYEVLEGDTSVYVGRGLPAYQMSLHNNLALFNGAVGVVATFSYESGATQFDNTLLTNPALVRGFFDPEAPFGEQAAAVAPNTHYGRVQDVSTWRFQSLSVSYVAPPGITRFFRAQRLSVAVQGSNLGIHSTYSGKDPNVNVWSPGTEVTRDTGQLGQPRLWQFRVDVSY